jgi:F420-dependent hydroxymycolic acid dehydrogenase
MHRESNPSANPHNTDLRNAEPDRTERNSAEPYPSGSPLQNRRTLLKSAAMVLGASALPTGAAGMIASGASRRPSSGSNTEGQLQARPVGPLRKGMVAFMLAHEQFTVPQLVELGAAAEKAGFDVLATSDHLQPWQSNEGHAGEAWVTFGALSQRTRHAWMGTTVTCPTFRYNPAVVAEAFASLSLLAPGRVFLGLGSGEALNEQAAVGSWPKWPERSERLIEATDVIRQLWKGEQVSHHGKYYTIDARLYDPPAKPIPLLMAANGPKAMRRAGLYGDGLITDPDTWKQHKGEFEEGAKAAGKDTGGMPVLVEQFVVVGDKKDAEAAAALWRFIPEAFKKYYNVRDPLTIQQRADAEVALEKVYGTWPVSTDPAVHIKAVNELFKSGATIVNIHSGQADQKKVIEFYGREVIPHVERG